MGIVKKIIVLKTIFALKIAVPINMLNYYKTKLKFVKIAQITANFVIYLKILPPPKKFVTNALKAIFI